MRFLYLAIVFLALCSCTNKKTGVKTDEKFIIRKHVLDIDTTIQEFKVFHNDILILLDNGRFRVIDSLYNRKKDAEDTLNKINQEIVSIHSNNSDLIFVLKNHKFIIIDSNYYRKYSSEKKLNKLKQVFFFKYFDTSWIINGKSICKIDSDYNFINRIPVDSFLISHPYAQAENLWSDSLYDVFGCCAGEFGGNVFFLNKKTLKSYLYPATCPEKAFKHNDNYYVIINLAHLRGSTTYLKIKDPALLFEPHTNLPENSFCCNCYSLNDTDYHLNNKERESRDERRCIDVYYDTLDMLTPFTFIRDNTIYSIQITGNNTYIVKHDNNKITLIDSIPGLKFANYANTFIQTQTINRSICYLRGGRESLNDKGKISSKISSYGIIIIAKNNIDLFEYYKEAVY